MNRGVLGAVLRLSRAAGAAPCAWERDGECRVSRALLVYSGSSMNRGVLGAVLRLSRAAGAAPCAWERDGECRVSRALLVYSGVLTTAISGYVCVRTTGIVLHYRGPWLALDYMRQAGRLLAALLLLLGAASAPRRLRRLATTRFKTKLPHCQRRRENKRSIVFVLAAFAACFAAHVVDVLLDKRSFENVFITLHQCALLFAQYVESLIVLQIVLSARRVARSLTALNDGLELLVPGLYSHRSPSMFEDKADTVRRAPRVAWEDAPSATHSNSNNAALAIRRHAQCHAAVCDVVRGATEADGLYLTAVLVLFSLRLGIVLYEIILWGLLIDQLAVSFLMTPLLFCALLLTTLIIIVAPFHDTHVQMQRTHFLVTNVKFSCRDDVRVTNELELFLRLLKLNRATYSPLGVCTLESCRDDVRVTNELELFLRLLKLNRATYSPLGVCTLEYLVYGNPGEIFATITTYLVAALTYGPERKKPALLAAYTTRVGQF
ncbi:uncharacterized protein [Maniola hyperantus]|uniref:uncharacterized protein n=1 Tax=Aphantopus hyperantus TaxID=2795564 RepID=UPI003749EA46